MHCADKLSTYEHKLGLLVALKLVLFGMLKLAKNAPKANFRVPNKPRFTNYDLLRM